MSSPLCKILRAILKMDKGATRKNGPNDKKNYDYQPSKDIDYMCQEKKQENDVSALRNCVDASTQGS